MIELTLAEQVWLMVAAPNTGRPRGATLGVTTDVAVFLELLAGVRWLTTRWPSGSLTRSRC